MSDELYMRRCIQLAILGREYVAPNPMVGAVIVHKNNIIGEGYHQKYGEAHAEVNAVHSVVDKTMLKDSTIYVSLEPCSHFGKTPPCVDLIIKHQFKRAVIGCLDTFSEVSGKGIERLKNAGIEVEMDVLKKECQELNKRFFTFHKKKRPFILLKWAQTRNGFIDDQGKDDGYVNWISAPETQVLVHKWRSENQAILVGSKTVMNDNPSLTVRAVAGKSPIRIILDPKLELKKDFSVFDGAVPTVILNEIKHESIGNLEYVKVDAINPINVVNYLYERNIQSILIEGGRFTLQSFIDAGIWDEAIVISGKNEFTSGTKAPDLCMIPVSSQHFFDDTLYFYKKI